MPTQQEYLKNGIDYADGLARFLNDEGLYHKFLHQFLNDPTYAQLEKGMAAGNVETAFQAAHTLKGVAGNLSLATLYSLLVPFTDALRGAGNMPLAKSLFPGVQKAYRDIIAYIKKI